jgi:hypothetical protein
MQWLARASPRGPDGSIGIRAAGLGLVLGRPVSAPAFGMPLASDGFDLLSCHRVAANDVTSLWSN